MSAQAAVRSQGRTNTESLCRQLAGTVLSLRATVEDVAALPIDAAAAATVLGLLEAAHRAIAFGQLRATFQADAAQVNRLDPGTASQIDRLARDPEELAGGAAHVPAEVLSRGMAPQRNTQAYLQAHLHISAAEARRRLTGARLLVAPAPPDPAGPTPPSGPDTGTPSYPVLAGAAADGSADVGTLAQLAGRLESMAPRIAPRPDADQVATAIEESLVQEARTGNPGTCHKALQDWADHLAEQGSGITEAEVLAKRGLFYRGFREGCDEFLLRCDPIDSEVIRSFGEAWSNPRSAKTPPRSASTTPRAVSGPGTVAGAAPDPASPDPASPDPEPVVPGPGPQPGMAPDPWASPVPGSTGVPLGTPIPAWAIAPGTPDDLVPVSQLECGAPPPRPRPPEPPCDRDTGFRNEPDTEPGIVPGGGPRTGPNADPHVESQVDSPFDAGTQDPAEDGRTTPQLLLDAVVGACAGVMDRGGAGRSGGLNVRVGVTIGYRSLLGQLEESGLTDHGRPVPAARVRALACSGGLLPVVLGSAGEVLDLGREVRSFTSAQRKALAIRDRGCVVSGCHRTAATSEAHHVWSWLEGGPTDVGNGCIICQYHHLMVHSGLITLRMVDGIPYVVARAGEPAGAPERNLFWHPELRTAGYTAPLFT
ncbi:DUF222 domain-containing protein [Paeniglutamicibacter sp. R2-26]|uniref:HNH endonuclease signature motif containing protein n=1 Tax=Paeniglutamicibacter sp. R2-26 TaxID=3144417 RepID=UPI003EE62BDB